MEDQADEISRIRTILMDNPKGSTIEDIAKKLPLNRTSTAKYLNTLHISGQAEMRTFGRAKVFTLSQRVPFSQMLNLSSDLLLVLDQNLVINQVNEPFTRVFGLSRDTLIGVPVTRSRFMPYVSENNMSLIQDAARGTEQTTIDRFEINGQAYFFKIKLIPLVFDQGGQGLAIILEDITELKKYQQHLEQLVEQRTHELKATNEQLVKEIDERRQVENALHQINSKLNLVSSIARHDILNRLTVIYGIISLLQEKITDPSFSDYLKKAEESAIAIKRQIEFTGDYKNMGKEKADWQNVNATLRHSCEDVDLKGVTMDIFSDELEIFADPWLKKVFFNLIDNTLRYAEHVTKITVSYRESEGGLNILFEDNGIGIPYDEKEKIFERGYGKNIGYGLFMAREILAITGLTIQETGEPGKGARYEINVPKRLYRIPERTIAA
jgi:PAS domain S-box-containing protein